MRKQTDPEQAVHGAPWAQIHGGYFSDPEVARPLVDVVNRIRAQADPDVIVDLGGGTGFLLAQIRACGVGREPAWVDLDCSPAQLQMAREAGITVVNGTVDSFRRADVVPAGARALFLMRSVLHYSGEAGLAPLLRHLRAQALPGEFWVHQTACFHDERDAACLNSLYQRMQTGKWYPTADGLDKLLHQTGWQSEDNFPASALHLESSELALRYKLTHDEIRGIARKMLLEYGQNQSVYHSGNDGFMAELHYRIFVSRAVS